MKRSLLLLPVLVLVLFACREKHTTTSAAPPAPDPNGYHPPVQTTENQGSEVVVIGNASDNNPGVPDSVVTTVVNTNTVTPTPQGSEMGNNPAQTFVDSSGLCRLVVQFASAGRGINHDAQKQFEQWLAKDVRGGFTYTKNPYGREGELNYCFDLKAKSKADQTIFVKEVREFLDGKDQVFVHEWVKCDKPKMTEVVVADSLSETVKNDSNVVRLVVSFISKGQGIDHTAQTDFEKWVGERPQFTYEKTSWGREGEVNYCFRMSNIDGRQQEVFIRDVRTFFSGNDMIIVSEWEKCDKRK